MSRTPSGASPPAPPPAFTLHLHGAPQVTPAEGAAVGLERRAAAVLALAALEPGVPRERVARWLWPDSADPRRNLRQQLLRFKQQFGQPLVAGEALLAIAPGVELAQGGTAVLLADLSFEDCEEFDAWLQARRAAQQAGATRAWREAVREAEQAGELDAALRHAEQWREHEPANEAAHQALMRVHFLRGDAAAGLAAHAHLVATLAHTEGRAPAPDTEALACSLREARPPVVAVPMAVPPSLLRPPRLVGRQRELAAVAAAWASTPVVWLLGEAGLGKSRLIDELLRIERRNATNVKTTHHVVAPTTSATPLTGASVATSAANSSAALPATSLATSLAAPLATSLSVTSPASPVNSPGATPAGNVLHSQARPGDSGVPFSTLARLLRSGVLESAAALDAARRQQLARVLPELAPTLPLPNEGQRLLLQGAVQALLAQGGITLVVLDDLHFADDASVEMLGALIGAGMPGPQRWLLAQRPAEGGGATSSLRDALQDDHALTPVALAPLDEAAMVELVDSLGLPGLQGPEVAAELVRHTGGNPLYALETLKARLLQAHPGARLPQPASVGALIERRLRQLSPPALALARVAALAGTDFDIELAEAVLGSSTLALAEPWAELEAAQVLREHEFAHDLVFEATLRTVPATVAARLHAQLAAHLEGRQAEPAHIAAHWLAARQGLKAVPWLVTAAERALGRFQRLAAGEHHRRAGDELLAAGQHDAAFTQFYRCAEAWAELSDQPRLEQMRDQLLALARSDEQWACAHLAAARVHDYLSDYEALGTASERVLHHARRSGDLEMQAQGLTGMQAALFYRGRGAEVLPLIEQERALWQAAGRPTAAARCEYNMGVSLVTLGRLSEAQEALARSVQAFEHLGDREMLVHALRELSATKGQRGLAAEALEGLRRTQALLLTLEYGAEDWSHVTVQLSRMWRRLASPGHALQVLDEFDQRFGVEQAGMRSRVFLERAELMLELGRAHGAWQALARAEQADASDLAHAARIQVLRRQLQAAGAAPPELHPPADFTRLTHPSLQLALARAAAAALPAGARASELARLVAEAESGGLVADALGLRADTLLAQCEAGLVDDAAQGALALAEALRHLTPALYPPRCWWAIHQALIAVDEPAAQAAAHAALHTALEWLARAVSAPLPADFVPAFLQLNPINRQLLAAAQQQPALAAQAHALLARLR